jgi:hypothetical protein
MDFIQIKMFSSAKDPVKKMKSGQALVSHACNPSYPGSRDQENHGSKPAGANNSQDPISKKRKKNLLIKRACGVTQSVDPEFQPQFHKNKYINKSKR